MISENERHYAEMVLGVIDTVECPMLMCEGEKAIVRKALKAYIENNDTADTPQTERIKTPDYCDICNHKGCDNCIANSLDDYCVPSGYEPITQTETQNSNLTFDTPQTESTGSPIGDYRDGVGAWQTDRMTEEEIDTMLAKALVGQTDCGWGEPNE